MKTFVVRDNVCSPYKLILHRVSSFLTLNGWKTVDKEDEAEVFIVGCCGAFQSLQEESIRLAEDAKRTGAELVVFGCLPRISPASVGQLMPDMIISAANWTQFESLVKNPRVSLDETPEVSEFRSTDEYRNYDPGKRFILIQTGCSSNCPYCPHKLGIGDLVSRQPHEILRQVELLSREEVHTIVLHGNDTASYGTDLGNITYPQLLSRILSISPNLHLSQLNADWVYEYRDELFPLLLNEKITEFQVLIQTTSDRLLQLMERRPVVKDLYPYLKSLRKSRSDIFLRTDIMIGYPTATCEEEEETIGFVMEIFDEVAVHGFERFSHTRINQMGLPYYSQEEIDSRVESAVRRLKSAQHLLVHRGGQIYQTLVEIEKPKEIIRMNKQSCLKDARRTSGRY